MCDRCQRGLVDALVQMAWSRVQVSSATIEIEFTDAVRGSPIRSSSAALQRHAFYVSLDVAPVSARL